MTEVGKQRVPKWFIANTWSSNETFRTLENRWPKEGKATEHTINSLLLAGTLMNYCELSVNLYRVFLGAWHCSLCPFNADCQWNWPLLLPPLSVGRLYHREIKKPAQQSQGAPETGFTRSGILSLLLTRHILALTRHCFIILCNYPKQWCIHFAKAQKVQRCAS